MSHFEDTKALLQYPVFVYFKHKFTGPDWRPWCQVLVSLNLVDGTKTTLKVKPPLTLYGSSIIEGKVLLTVGNFSDGDYSDSDDCTTLTNLSTGNVLAQVAGLFSPVKYQSLGDEDDDHLCYVRRQKKLYALRSGKLFSGPLFLCWAPLRSLNCSYECNALLERFKKVLALVF